MIPRHFILEFLEPKSTQDQKKRHSKSLQKSTRFLIRFLLILAPFCTPRAAPKFNIFHYFLLLVPLLGHLGAKRTPKVLQDGSRTRFSKKFGPFWGQFSKDFVRFRSLFFIQFLTKFPIPCFIFDDISTGLLQFVTLFFQPQVRHGGGLARAAHWMIFPLQTAVVALLSHICFRGSPSPKMSNNWSAKTNNRWVTFATRLTITLARRKAERLSKEDLKK